MARAGTHILWCHMGAAFMLLQGILENVSLLFWQNKLDVLYWQTNAVTHMLIITLPPRFTHFYALPTFSNWHCHRKKASAGWTEGVVNKTNLILHKSHFSMFFLLPFVQINQWEVHREWGSSHRQEHPSESSLVPSCSSTDVCRSRLFKHPVIIRLKHTIINLMNLICTNPSQEWNLVFCWHSGFLLR